MFRSLISPGFQHDRCRQRRRPKSASGYGQEVFPAAPQHVPVDVAAQKERLIDRTDRQGLR